MSFNDNNKGRTNKKKTRKNMKLLGAKGAATKANAAMDRDLEDFSTHVRALGERWTTRHASATPNGEGDIVSVLCSSGAFVIASDTARMKSRADRKLPVSLFDVRVTKNHTLSVCMLSEVIPEAPLALVVCAAGSSLQVASAGSSAAAAADWTFPKMVMHVGLSSAVLAVLNVLCSDTVRLCSGVPIDAKTEAHLKVRADPSAALLEPDLFHDRNGQEITARVTRFPGADASVVTTVDYGPDVDVIRTTDCGGIISSTGSTMCVNCARFRHNSLRLAVSVGSFAAPAALANPKSKVSNARLAASNPKVLAERQRATAAELKAVTRQRDRLLKTAEADSMEAGEDTNVVFADGTTEPVSSIFKEADGYLKDGILKEPGAVDLFKEGGMFRMVWDAQMRGAQTKDAEEKKQRALHPDLPAKKATGRGMRYNPVMMHWALRLYGQGRAAYRTAQEANPTIPSERYVTLIKTHTP